MSSSAASETVPDLEAVASDLELRLIDYAMTENEAGNRKVVENWLKTWVPLGDTAIDALCGAFDPGGAAAIAAKNDARAFRASLGFAT